jgi:O-antigen ligase
MRRAVPAAAAACLLAGPTVLAFFSGGYFTEPRLVAAIVAWALVLAVTAVGPAPLPRSAGGRLALGGLVAITVWSALSVTWAPLRGPAIQNVQRLVLYVGVLVLAIGVLRTRRALRAVEPALALGGTIVIGYGLSGRLLPGVVHLARSRSAGGRLEQPITYWNAEGALAAVALVLCARIAGDRTRPAWMRAAAAAAAAPLGAGVYLSYSRGAIAAGLVGLVVLVAAVPTRAQLRAAVVALATAVAAAACSALFPGVASLAGSHRARDGAVLLALLALVAAAAGLQDARRAAADDDEPLRWSRRLGPIAAVVAGAAAVGLVIGGLSERPSAAELAAGAKPTRLTSVSSNRYEYWRVGLRAFERHPLDGLGSGGFRVFWLRERPIPEAVKDVHSLEFEMAAELGLVGLLAFAAMVAGVALAARRALHRHRPLAAGSCAAALVWLLHASIDWDWEVPAVTLPAIVLAGALIALSEEPLSVAAHQADRAGAARPAPAARRRGRRDARTSA